MNKPYVAIVDDDAGFGAYLRTFLSLRGYEARCYTRGDELLAAMKQSEAPDVVLLDVMMPGLDGIATLRALKSSRPEAQVIMLSGRNQASTIVEAVRLGAADYVVKPDDPEGLGEIALDVAIKNAIEKNRLVSELTELRQQLSDDEGRSIWGNSEKMRAISTVIEQVSDSDVTVLIRGESGVGKELVARAIHQRSTRKNRPFVKVNCAALPAELLESELFGHERGAFTGAIKDRPGRFEAAEGGTIFLDDVDDVPMSVQVKLLRVLQNRVVERVGGARAIPIDVRTITGTKRDLRHMVSEGKFREDLYYRLNVIPITLPPLRERREDIPLLAEHFLKRFYQRRDQPVRPLSPGVLQAFMRYPWPGNVRELENACERIAQTCTCDTVKIGCVPISVLFHRSNEAAEPIVETHVHPSSVSLEERLRDVEQGLITWALKVAGGNKSKAAELLQIKRSTLGDRIKKLGLPDQGGDEGVRSAVD